MPIKKSKQQRCWAVTSSLHFIWAHAPFKFQTDNNKKDSCEKRRSALQRVTPPHCLPPGGFPPGFPGPTFPVEQKPSSFGLRPPQVMLWRSVSSWIVVCMPTGNQHTFFKWRTEFQVLKLPGPNKCIRQTVLLSPGRGQQIYMVSNFVEIKNRG